MLMGSIGGALPPVSYIQDFRTRGAKICHCFFIPQRTPFSCKADKELRGGDRMEIVGKNLTGIWRLDGRHGQQWV